MKLIKLITAVVMSFGLMIAQPPTQGGNQGGTQGPPPCDEWLNSDMAHDMNDDGEVNEGDCPGQGPDPFQQAFMTTMQNGGTPDEAFEAVAAVFHQMEVECDDCEMTEEEFQEGKAEAKAAFDAVLANGGTPEEAFHAAMETSSNDGPGTCDVCGYEYGGEDDHHGHCRVCDAEMNADEDWQAHCEENPDHCKAQAGDVCGFRGWDGQGEECGYVHTGDPGEDHHHCDHCGLAVNSGEEMHNHMQADHPDMMEQHEDGGGDHDGGGTCDVCGHEYGGPDDHHGHCRVCGAEMNTDDDWRAHCDDNWEHCKPQAGDTCGYVGPSGDECGYVHTGDPDEDHHHCDTCGMPVNSGDEMGAHCDENPGHCHDDGGGDHEGGDGDQDGGPPFEDVYQW